MSLEKYRIGLIAWSFSNNNTSQSDTYINLGEIYDKEVVSNVEILITLHNQLKYLYPFKIKKVDDKISVYNDEDFEYFRRKFKITSKVHLYNYISKSDENTERIIFKRPQLYNISHMKQLFSNNTLQSQTIKMTPHRRIFIVSPYDNPVLRGKILDSCMSLIKEKNPIFILIGDRYGKNKESTSTLMKRYLLSNGICTEKINIILYDKFPDFIPESLNLLPIILNVDKYVSHDIFIASKSTDMRKIMSYVKYTKLNKNIKIQYICE